MLLPTSCRDGFPSQLRDFRQPQTIASGLRCDKIIVDKWSVGVLILMIFFQCQTQNKRNIHALCFAWPNQHHNFLKERPAALGVLHLFCLRTCASFLCTSFKFIIYLFAGPWVSPSILPGLSFAPKIPVCPMGNTQISPSRYQLDTLSTALLISVHRREKLQDEF